MKKIFNILVILLKIFIPMAIIVCAMITGIVFYYLGKIPDVTKIDESGYEFVSRLYTKDGKHIDDYYKTTRYYIPINEVSQHTIDAFLAAEDAYFFQNIGVDFKGIFRASIQNIKSKIFKSGGVQGASTITQQLVKNVLLTNEKTFDRKIKEILLSIIITREVSKEKILELYLNYIFFGFNSYGIESASLEYFGKHAKDLNIQESATLASMPKAPSIINPRTSYDRTLARRNWVIDQMVQNNFLDSKTAQVAKESQITLAYGSLEEGDVYGGYNSISQHIALVEAKKLKIEDIYTRGYLIKSTVDSNLQETLFKVAMARIDAYQKKHNLPTNQVQLNLESWCEELSSFAKKHYETQLTYGVVLRNNGRYNVDVGYYKNGRCLKVNSIALQHAPKKGYIVILERQSRSDIKKLRLPQSVEKIFVNNPLLIKPVPQPNFGAIVMSLKSGKVLAMSGDYFNLPNSFNRVTQAKRQVGSTIKPFIYSTALENGFSPASKFIDAPITLGRNWKPENHSHDYLGAITLRKSLERSRNITTVRIADAVGVEKIKETFVRFGFVHESDEFDLSSALGSTSITPLELIKAYSVFANGGSIIEPTFIDYIQSRDGKIIWQNSSVNCVNCENSAKPRLETNPNKSQIISPEVAFQIHSILQGTATRGTAWKVGRWLGEGFAGKTGTTSYSKDSWFVGYNGNVIMAVYVGFDDSTSLGEHEYGATLAMPIFIDFMRATAKLYPPKPVQKPHNLQEILINRDTGRRVLNEGDGVIVEYFKKEDKIPPMEDQVSTKLYGY